MLFPLLSGSFSSCILQGCPRICREFGDATGGQHFSKVALEFRTGMENHYLGKPHESHLDVHECSPHILGCFAVVVANQADLLETRAPIHDI